MLGPITGLPQKRKEYTRVSFTNATAYIHKDRVHYRFRGADQAERDQRATDFAAAHGGVAMPLPGKPGLIARIDGDFRPGPTDELI